LHCIALYFPFVSARYLVGEFLGRVERAIASGGQAGRQADA
jgi:hypothetical protein